MTLQKNRPSGSAARISNRRAAAFFGVELKDVANYRWIDLVHPDDRESVLAAWEIAKATGKRYRHEHRLKQADGQYRPFLAEALPLRAADGSIEKWYGVVTPLDTAPRIERPRDRPVKVDYYPIRDASGLLELLEVAVWTDRPDDPAAKLHPCGVWYRVEPVEGAG